MVILCGQHIRKLNFENFESLATRGQKPHKQVVYQSSGNPPGTTQNRNKLKNT